MRSGDLEASLPLRSPARVFKWHGVYYVTVDERFDRCGGARSRFPDWFESYAVSPTGVVLARHEGGR